MHLSDDLPPAKASARSLRILVVDDSVVIRGTIRAALDKLERPLTVIEAAAGDEALAIMRQSQVNMIFCDIHLPGISGLEALAYAFARQEHPPFMVLMSSLDAESVREVGRKLRVYEFLQKPFRTSDVLNAVAAHDRLSTLSNALVVDDSSTARKLMRRILERSQFQEAESGAEAVKLAGVTNFEVIFLDANMPGMNGPETAGHLLRANARTQIVMVSTEQQLELIRSSQYAGAFAFLTKPFQSSDVNAVLHSAFSIRAPSLARPTHAIFSDVESANGGVERRATP
jgi:CheY-like chemotaxis protein